MSSSLREELTWDEMRNKARSLGWDYGKVYGGHGQSYYDWFKIVDGKRLVRGYPINGDGLLLWRKEVETKTGLSKFNEDYPISAEGADQ